jgi:hypothetical protein
MAEWIDHVLMSSADFERSAKRLLDESGLVAVPGGSHPGGTRNWIVTINERQYLELIGVGDERTMRSSALGRWLIRELERPDHVIAWAVGTDDIEAVARRTHIESVGGSIREDSGDTGGWRAVNPAGAAAATLPFFIQYDGELAETMERRRLGYDEANSPAKPTGIAHLDIGGDPGPLREWLGDVDLPVRFVAGPPGLRACAIDTASGHQIVLR